MTNMQGAIVIAGRGPWGAMWAAALRLLVSRLSFLPARTWSTLSNVTDCQLAISMATNGRLDPQPIRATDDPAEALAEAALVLVCVKSHDTIGMAQAIDRCAPERSPIVSLQNSAENAARIQRSLHTPLLAISGMVPLNVVLDASGRVRAHRATDGDILVDAQIPGLADALRVEGLSVAACVDMKGALWSKLLMSLNNALVALSGLTLAEELRNRAWRKLLARQIDEALAAMKRPILSQHTSPACDGFAAGHPVPGGLAIWTCRQAPALG